MNEENNNEILESLLETYGWTIECYSPLEIRHKDGSFADKLAAQLIIESIKNGCYDE